MNLAQEFKKFLQSQGNISSVEINSLYTKHSPSLLTPYIIEERPLNIAQMDVFSRLMMDRIIFIGEPINDYVANIVTAQLLFLDSLERGRDIQMYINSPGGSIYSGMAVYDTMQYITSDVATICVGMAASLGAVLLCAGKKNKRTALKHSRIMLHQPSGGIGGQASDIEITAREIKKLKNEIYDIIAQHSGQSEKKVSNDCQRDFWMTSQGAKDYGLIDEVLLFNKKP